MISTCLRILIFVQFIYFAQSLVNESDQKSFNSDESNSSKNGSNYISDGDSNRRQLISNFESYIQSSNPSKESETTTSSEIETSFRSSDPETYGIMNFNQWLQSSLFTQYDTPMEPMYPSVHERSNIKYPILPESPSQSSPSSSIPLLYQTPPPQHLYSKENLRELNEPEPERRRSNEAYILDQHQEILNLLHIVLDNQKTLQSKLQFKLPK